MKKTKLIMESWRKYLQEEEEPDPIGNWGGEDELGDTTLDDMIAVAKDKEGREFLTRNIRNKYNSATDFQKHFDADSPEYHKQAKKAADAHETRKQAKKAPAAHETGK
jgi:hypothetical protein